MKLRRHIAPAVIGVLADVSILLASKWPLWVAPAAMLCGYIIGTMDISFIDGRWRRIEDQGD